jgi:predicted Fe-Mo cluster-binding NifX family protein
LRSGALSTRGNLLKVAVSSTGPHLSSAVCASFGRCACFLVVDLDTEDVAVVENTGAELDSGAGSRSVQLLANAKASTVLTGRCGPKAARALAAARIDVHCGCDGTVAEAIAVFAAGRPR